MRTQPRARISRTAHALPARAVCLLLYSRKGQAMAELVIMLIALLTLITGAVTLGSISLNHCALRRDLRLETGREALVSQASGWSEGTLNAPETRAHPLHRINAYTRLEAYHPALESHLPASNYTLRARNLPEAELGFTDKHRDSIIPLDDVFIDLIYGKPTIRVSEELSMPGMTGLAR